MDEREANFKSLYDSALAKAVSGDEAGAESGFNDASTQFPDLWCDMAQRLVNTDNEFAIHHLSRALELSKSCKVRAILLNDIGRIYTSRGQNLEALEYFKQALNNDPGHASILRNIGLAHRWLGNFAEAERWLNRSLKVNPWENDTLFEMSFLKMLQGDYLKGFELYEARFRFRSGLKKLECNKPEWDGSNGKRLLVYGEQGSGDIFLMLRYARLIRERGLHQTWVVHKPMVPLVATMPEIDAVYSDGTKLEDYDCQIACASLPRIFKTTLDTIPTCGYIARQGEIESCDQCDGSGCDNCGGDGSVIKHFKSGFHVGIVWRGSKAQNNDKIRSTNLDDWLPVLNVPGVTFHSLQVDNADEAIGYPQIQMDTRPRLEGLYGPDWLDTAKRVCGLDLVISVDTSMVHLCGAMGVECWCALHCRPYFVYPPMREDCPWYKSVRLFKQQREFEWKPVFERIAEELKRRVNAA